MYSQRQQSFNFIPIELFNSMDEINDAQQPRKYSNKWCSPRLSPAVAACRNHCCSNDARYSIDSFNWRSQRMKSIPFGCSVIKLIAIHFNLIETINQMNEESTKMHGYGYQSHRRGEPRQKERTRSEARCGGISEPANNAVLTASRAGLSRATGCWAQTESQ